MPDPTHLNAYTHLLGPQDKTACGIDRIWHVCSFNWTAVTCPRCLKTAGQSGTNREEPMSTDPITALVPAYRERFKHEWNMAAGPHHEHDCEGCAYLGTDLGYKVTDLYWCEQGGRPTPIARQGDYGDYESGRDFIDRSPLLALAYVRAVKAGLLYTDVLPGLGD